MSFLKAKKSRNKNRSRITIGSQRNRPNRQDGPNKPVSKLSRESSRRQLLRSKWIKSIDGEAMQTKGDNDNYTATVFRDSEGAKMVLDVSKGKKITDARELIRDIEGIRSTQDQKIFKDGESLPQSIILRGLKNPKALVDALNEALAEGNADRDKPLRATLVDTDNSDGIPTFKFDIVEGDPDQKTPPPIPPDPGANQDDRPAPAIPDPPSQGEEDALRRFREDSRNDSSEQDTTSETDQYGKLPLRPRDESDYDSVDSALDGPDTKKNDGYETTSAVKARINQRDNDQYDSVDAPLEGNDPRDQYESLDSPIDGQRRQEQDYDSVDLPLSARRPTVPADTIYRTLNLKQVSTTLMDLKAFKDGTKNRSLKARTPEFKAIEQSFTNYQKQLDTFKNTAQNILDITGRPAREKLTMLDQKYAIEKQIKFTELDINGQAKYMQDQVNAFENTSNPDERESIQRKIDDAANKIEVQKSNLIDLERSLESKEQEIALKDAEINDMIDSQNSFIAKRQEALNATSKDLKNKIDQYLRDNVNSNNTQKIDTLGRLANQVGDIQQDSARLSEAIESITGVARDNQLAKPMKALKSDTASHVFTVETKGLIGQSNTNQGFAKRATGADDPENDATKNLGFLSTYKNDAQRLDDAPNLIARQVVSSRIDQVLGLNVLASEVFSKSLDGKTIGITAKADGKEMMKKGKSGDIYRNFPLTDANIQKGLSDLQIMDAITGQLDRHMGNIMIDPKTGKVTGIDNDMAFSIEGPNITINNTLRGQFTETTDGRLVYNQKQIHKDTADAIEGMTVAQFKKILEGSPADPEKMDPVAIEHAVKRFEAVQNQVINLRKQGKLIDKFKPTDYADAIAQGNEKTEGETKQHNNYLARAVSKYNEAGQPDNPNIQED